MWMERRRIVWKAAALATGCFAATAWAWEDGPIPRPPTGPIPAYVGPGLRIPPTRTGPPVAEPGPRTYHQWLHDTYLGRPQDFVEPPLGFYIYESFGIMKTRADPHRFTLYRSDFLPGSTLLSPTGATRFNLMASRLPAWLGPVTIEWSPDEPGLAEARQAAVVAALQGVGLPIIPERVVIGPSPYPGTLGTDAANYYNIMIQRDMAAPAGHAPSPVISSGAFFGGVR